MISAEVGMLEMKLLESVRFVVDSQGKKAAVQLDLNAWEALLAYLEEVEDRRLVREKLNRLPRGPEQSGAMPWDATKKEW
jgi:predicted DNA-binding protein